MGLTVTWSIIIITTVIMMIKIMTIVIMMIKNNDNSKNDNTCVQWLVIYIEDKVLNIISNG